MALDIRQSLLEENFDLLTDTRLWIYNKFMSDSSTSEEKAGAIAAIIRIHYDRSFDGVPAIHRVEFEEYAGHWLKTHGSVVGSKVVGLLEELYPMPDVSRIPEESIAFM